MIKKTKNFLIACCILVNGVSAAVAQTSNRYVKYVDPFIGVRDKSTSCVLGPQLPHGSINPSPETPSPSEDDMDGYTMGQPIRGFAQLHVSGTGWGKYGQVFISPQLGLATAETAHDSPKKDEIAHPYEYSVNLARYDIGVSVAPAIHSAIYRLTFPKSDSSCLVLDVSHNIGDIAKILRGEFLDGSLTFTSSMGDEIKGYGDYRGGFVSVPYRVYFCLRLSRKPVSFGTWINGKSTTGHETEKLHEKNDKIGAFFRFKTHAQEEVFVKVAVSLKSQEQASKWLDIEIPRFDYEQVKKTATNLWEVELKKIVVDGGTEREKKLFYTTLYHASVMPRDRTNDIEGFDRDVPVWDDHFAVWDTWRTLYPLQALINPDMVSSTINSFIARFNKNRKVKDVYVTGNDMSAEQGGNDVTNIITDAYVKGIKGVNWQEAYKVVKFQADSDRMGTSYGRPDSSKMYKSLGWIPAGKMSCSVSLEYSYNDFCAAQMAKGLRKNADFLTYKARSEKWVNLWDPDLEDGGFKGFIAPKKLNGNFISIDPKKIFGSWKDYFYEGNSWTYSYFVPQDFPKLVSISGGKELFSKKMQYCFENKLIDYGNEPAFLAVQGFHYAGRSDLASYYVRKLMRERFTEEGNGDNDDSGAMSSWYIFSAMGFFPNAGQDFYYLTGPMFKKTVLSLGNGKTLRIIAPKASSKNIYVRRVTFNGKYIKTPLISHQMLSKGGTLFFDMDERAPKRQAGI